MNIPTVDPRARRLVVRAYAHAIMEDLLTDYALNGKPLPTSLDEALNAGFDFNDLGTRFEETFLQGNAPQWSVGAARGEAEMQRAFDVRNEAVNLVSIWLGLMGEHNGHISDEE